MSAKSVYSAWIFGALAGALLTYAWLSPKPAGVEVKS